MTGDAQQAPSGRSGVWQWLFCCLFGHRLVLPTGPAADEPISCARCRWKLDV